VLAGSGRQLVGEVVSAVRQKLLDLLQRNWVIKYRYDLMEK
jgi:hypothetical protein